MYIKVHDLPAGTLEGDTPRSTEAAALAAILWACTDLRLQDACPSRDDKEMQVSLMVCEYRKVLATDALSCELAGLRSVQLCCWARHDLCNSDELAMPRIFFLQPILLQESHLSAIPLLLAKSF